MSGVKLLDIFIMKDVIVIKEHPSNSEMRKKIKSKCDKYFRDRGLSKNTKAAKRRYDLMLWLYGLNKPSKRKMKRIEKRLGKRVVFNYKD